MILLEALAVLLAAAGSGWLVTWAARRTEREDTLIDTLIGECGVNRESGKRACWTDYNPDLRERANAKRATEAAVRARANRIAVRPVNGKPADTLAFKR